MLRNPLPEIRAKVPERSLLETPVGPLAHLGGYVRDSAIGDYATYHPNMWTWAVAFFGIRSVIDIGCGQGHSTEYFHRLGCDVLGVEGYEPAIASSPVPEKIERHDYTAGPYVPERTFDMAWSCEFVEHVEERFAPNYFATFEKATMVFLTFATPGQGGHHHVNEQPEEYWIEQFARHGLVFDQDATRCARLVAEADRYLVSPDFPSHFTTKGLVMFRR